jgi:hypothetical protein
VSLRALLLALAVGILAPTANAGAPVRLAELPGVEALPNVPPLNPPQPPLTEVARLRGTVFAQNRVIVGIDAGGAPRAVSVAQRLLVRALGDYTFFVPAPALSVVAAAGTESQPGFRPNQIVWQGFSPRRKVLAARAALRLPESIPALPLRIRVTGAPTGPGPFELVVSLENATYAQGHVFSATAAVESDLAAALAALRGAARSGRAVEEETVRIKGQSAPALVGASAVLAARGTVDFPDGAVSSLSPARFSVVLGAEKDRTVRITVRGVARRSATPKIRIVAEPLVRAALPRRPVRDLASLIRAYLGYARTRQFLTFLANPDPNGKSTTSYVFETAAAERSVARPEREESGRGVPAAVLAIALALVGLGLVVLWAHL